MSARPSRRPSRPLAKPGPDVGRRVELEIGPIAHGGHCVARLEGRVVFVRHTLPGERILAELTEAGQDAAFWRADAVEILSASPDRVPSAWPEAGPGGVGGGEFAHIALAAQRRLKADVLAEQLRRLAHVETTVEVEGLPGDDELGGLHYRTRFDLVADPAGRAGMRRFRSHTVVPLSDMPLATQDALALAEREEVFTRRWRPGSRIEVVAPADGEAGLILVDGVPWHGGRVDRRPNTRRSVLERVEVGSVTYEYRVSAAGFWQVHRAAPAALTRAVLDGLGDVAGARVGDLYSGAGLFTVPLADAVEDAGSVLAVEADATAVRDARRILHDRPCVRLVTGEVAQVLASGDVDRLDAIVMDPPRAGAGRKVVDRVAQLGPARVVYVACDPAALARDIGYFAGHGYVLSGVRGLDLFPMNHHVEAVAVLDRKAAP